MILDEYQSKSRLNRPHKPVQIIMIGYEKVALYLTVEQYKQLVNELNECEEIKFNLHVCTSADDLKSKVLPEIHRQGDHQAELITRYTDTLAKLA